jgi:hypothetical protein
MSLAEMLNDLPTHCAVGTKRNAKGHTESWIGYKLDIPISGLLTSASLHDSRAGIPLAKLTAARLTNLYDLMDSAYDAPEIAQTSRDLGHVPIIDKNPRRTPSAKAELEAETRRQRYPGYRLAEDLRYNERSGAERVNGGSKMISAGATCACAATPRSYAI